ncbi:putative AAA domain-containing protein, R3H [Helianthus annuus]|uniref:AAA domain-containing protein, R3H n=1 Tax=Helianthus annuus TaxID=4232 RepID=A0A251SD37_HELAN|nr:protein SEEDLING PLASTID DEVELOPMENT 1 [Helianthus annuus]XP_035839929.1 protein SEEDLING PLASTID DEVELOPMENT 1 [Helianthus annuus]KAF5766574.1 putative AAA domain-containing protein, R3H [Helianthus annuus]KAJ0833231.1 putative AAA domain-containing protein, R3H [Helianthus annuus]
MLCLPIQSITPHPKTPFGSQTQVLRFFSTTKFLHHHHHRKHWNKIIHRSDGYSPCCCLKPDTGLSWSEEEFDMELGRMLRLLPEEMRRRVNEHQELHQLIEVVMDLGRKPLARFPSGDFMLSDDLITVDDLEHATSLVGDFAIDNRAGISRTLHRISAIRNRKGTIIGLTCRVGRAVSGSAKLLQDLVKDGASLLLIGPPGVGKTTIIRDVARMLANDYNKRVMIVDTSNEIGGDGDIPHSGIGNARRMQVPDADMQHKVLIEAVENHMPQVIVIDEIGTKLEAAAASTIAQRGIQLVATAHGITIENLVMNPSLDMLVGGIQSVTLGDEEANRRGVQKSVLERKGPSTFDCAVEIISRLELRVHSSLEATVDAILSGRSPNYQVCKGVIDVTLQSDPIAYESFVKKSVSTVEGGIPQWTNEKLTPDKHISKESQSDTDTSYDKPPLCLFLYGVSETTSRQVFKHLKMESAVEFTENISEADAILALLSKIKKNSRIQAAAHSNDIPIYVTKTSSLTQLTKAIEALVTDYDNGFEDVEDEYSQINESEKTDALEEARIAIEQVVIPKGEPVELLPRQSNILLLQKGLIRKYKLQAQRVGSEADVRLRILPFQAEKQDKHDAHDDDDDDDGDTDALNELSNANGSPYPVNRLPFLPD